MSFESLGLKAELLRAIAESGYTTPTPIQEKAIPVVLGGRDVMGIAQTGTGKTAGFTLPMIQRLSSGRAKARMPRSLILEPTRELAAQVAESFEKYGKHLKLSMALLIGGVSYDEQDIKIMRGVDVLIATPGRLLDQFERGKLLLNGVQILVVDEADRMLDMGFIPDIERICKMLPFTRQTLFFSATMPPEITRLADQFLSNPERIEVSKPASAAATIEQKIIGLPANDTKLKREALRRIIRGQAVVNGIIFCNRKTDVDIVYKSLTKHGFSVAALHGVLPQPVRTKTLENFRAGEIQLLVASDVAARGLDIPAVSHVFNFDVPINAEDYVHRIGRTGRAGRQGFAFMLAGPKDYKFVSAIEALITTTIPREEMTDIEVTPDHRQNRADGPRERDGRRGRGGDRGRSRHQHQGPHHDQVAGLTPIDQTLTSEESVPIVALDVVPAAAAISEPARPSAPQRDRQPRKDRGRRDNGPRDHGQKAQRETGAQRPNGPKENAPKPVQAGAKAETREQRPRRNDDDAAPTSASMGDHMPAFLLRPVPQHLIRRKKESEVA